MKSEIEKLITPIRLEYTIVPGRARTRFLNGLEQGRLIGQRCPECLRVYIPLNGACTTCGVPTDEQVEIADTGTVTTFCVVNIPFEGQSVEIPFVAAMIVLDGAHTPFFHIIQEIPAHEVRMGLRVKAVWVAPEHLEASLEAIRYFKPSGEPDAPYESFKEYL